MGMSKKIKPNYSNRGFKHLDPITDAYGGKVTAYESSAAMGPHLWLKIEQAPTISPDLGEAVSHLSLKQAKKLRKQLKFLIKNHYQVQWAKEEE
jgi:hypothetical protein